VTAALTNSDLGTVAFVCGVLVLLGAAYVGYMGRLAQAGVIAVIGVILLLLAT
jgi:uncharacterized membrane protein